MLDENIVELFARAGFSKVIVKKSYNPGHWALSLQNLYLHRFPETKLKNGKSWIYPFCLLAALPFTLIENVFSLKADIIYFEARK